MTYEELRKWINSMTSEQRSKSVTIYNDETDEFYSVHFCWISTKNDTDVVDENTPVITFSS